MSLKAIIDSTKETVSNFNLTDTFPVDDEWMMDKADTIRELLIQQNVKKIQQSMYQLITCLEIEQVQPGCTINGIYVPTGGILHKVVLPELVQGIGDQAIRYFGLADFKGSFTNRPIETFQKEVRDRWTNKQIKSAFIGRDAYLKNVPCGMQRVWLVAIVKHPRTICDYDDETSDYPCPAEYKLELLLAQDILSSMGIDRDELNDQRNTLMELKKQAMPRANVESQQEQQEQ